MRRIDLNSGEIARMYESGISVNKLAQIFGVDRSTIDTRLDRLGIQRRGLSEAQFAAFKAAHPAEHARTCTGCSKTKPIEDFSLHAGRRRHACRDCLNQHARKWRAENKPKIRAYNSKWYSKNREAAIEQVRRSRTGENLEAHKNARRKHYRENKEDIIAARSYRRAARGKFTKADILEIRRMQRNRCAICRDRLSKEHIDHIVPLAKGGTNHKRNLQLLCPSCNFKKSKRDPIDHMRTLGRLL